VHLALPASSAAGQTAAQNSSSSDSPATAQTGPLAQRALAFERAQVLAELERHGRRVTPTAKALGLERSHLYKKCQQLGIDLHSLKARDD
jgi:DNA-binding NtrC family response regulator